MSVLCGNKRVQVHIALRIILTEGIETSSIHVYTHEGVLHEGKRKMYGRAY